MNFPVMNEAGEVVPPVLGQLKGLWSVCFTTPHWL